MNLYSTSLKSPKVFKQNFRIFGSPKGCKFQRETATINDKIHDILNNIIKDSSSIIEANGQPFKEENFQTSKP